MLLKRIAAIFALILLCVTPMAWAQTQAQLTGRVTDDTRAVVPQADVLLRNTDTGVVLTTKTNSSGLYTFPQVQPGPYEVMCEFPGFKRAVRGGLVLETGMSRSVDLKLEIGAVTESVAVVAAAPLLETESNNVGQFIERKNVQNMPLQSRRAAGLVRLMGNVVYEGDPGAESAPRFTLAGGRQVNQMTLLDGGVVQNMTLGVAQQLVNPPAEALQEFKISASNHSAEFGRAGSGLVLMTTRSGTNEFHGAGYWFLRNDKLDARNFFAKDKEPLRFNIYGGSLGGPIIQDKSFFFFNYEGNKRRRGLVFAGNEVPHPASVRGDFSARTDVTVLDPATGKAFPGNIIPPSRINPTAARLLAYYPAPNVAGNDVTKAPRNNYDSSGSDQLDQESYIGRWDHSVNDFHRAFVRIAYLKGTEVSASIFPDAVADNRANTRDNSNIRITGTWISNLQPTLINEFRSTYGRRKNLAFGPGTTSGVNAELGIGGVEQDGFPQVGITGLRTLGRAHQRIQEPIYTFTFGDTVTWVKNRHTIKFGGEFRYSMNTDINQPSANGQYTFSNRATKEGLATLLLGWTSRVQRQETLPLRTRSDFWGAFIQDDWRVSSKLTLNLGVRWDMDTPRWEKDNRQSGFNEIPTNPVSGTPGIITFAGIDGVSKYINDFDPNNIGPRFGFAYRMNDKMVLRGGYGLYYNGLYQSAVANQFSAGFGSALDINSPDGGFTPVQVFGDAVPAPAKQELWPGYGAVAPGKNAVTSLHFAQQDQMTGYMQHFNFSVQRQLVENLMFEAAYLANIGRKLGGPDVNRNVIPLVDGRGPAKQSQALRLWPQYNNVNQVSPVWGDSEYHSLNLKLEKRYSNGLNFLTNFTWSKYMTNTDSGGWREIEGQRVGYQHPELRRPDWSISNADIPLRFVGSVMYELPFGEGRHYRFSSGVADKLFGGWGVGAILELRDGSPYGVVEQTNVTNTYGSGQRPNLTGNPIRNNWNSRQHMINEYFTTSAFAHPGVGLFGNAARNIGYGPGFTGVDFSVHKRWALAERIGLMYRCDFFNLPNRPNFGHPNTTFGSASFGTITSAKDARILQMNLRLEF